MSTIAFLGLGVMGAPMACYLARAGNHVVVYNRTSSKAEAWVGEYGNQVSTYSCRGRGWLQILWRLLRRQRR